MSSREINKKAAVSTTSIHSFRKKTLQPARTLPLQRALSTHTAASILCCLPFLSSTWSHPLGTETALGAASWAVGANAVSLEWRPAPPPGRATQKASSHRREARVGLPGCKATFRRSLLPSLCGDDTGCCLQHHKRKYSCPSQSLLETVMP